MRTNTNIKGRKKRNNRKRGESRREERERNWFVLKIFVRAEFALINFADSQLLARRGDGQRIKGKE